MTLRKRGCSPRCTARPSSFPSATAASVAPLLTTTKAELTHWCERHRVDWSEDKSNADVSSPRNRIRHNILPEVLKVNPGFLTVMRKKVIASNGEHQ